MGVEEELAILSGLLESARAELRAGNQRAATTVAVLEQMVVERERLVADEREQAPVRLDG